MQALMGELSCKKMLMLIEMIMAIVEIMMAVIEMLLTYIIIIIIIYDTILRIILCIFIT